MNFMERIGGGGFLEQEQSDEEEERIEEEAKTTRRNNITSATSKHQYISNLPSTSSSSGSAAATTSPHHFSYKDFLPRLSQEFTHPRTPPPPPGAHLAGGEGTSSMMMMEEEVEKEHMFEKVVTPSDVGKLNRLVIPKQHAERHFPLDGSSNEKGLLLNFEDPDGKPWRFRYSYWNSSQSYVMTKGWSRFVKDKKLDAGDIVSFHRGAREDSRHRLFIDWKRRPTIDFPNVRWGNRLLYALPHAPAPPPFHYSYNLQVQPYPGHYSHLYARGGPTPYYVRPTGHLHNHYLNAGEGGGISGGVADGVLPMVIDSLPVVQGRTVGKRLRLFGVNMDCPISGSGYDHQHQHHHHHHHPEEADNRPMHGLILPPPRHSGSSSSSSPGAGSSLQLRQPSGGGGGGSSTSTQSHELSKKGKSTSLSFDLDL